MKKLKPKPLHAAWENYQRMVLPSIAGPGQVTACKMAFFTGASVTLQVIMIGMSDGSEPTDTDVELLSILQAEMAEFGQELDAAVLGKVRH